MQKASFILERSVQLFLGLVLVVVFVACAKDDDEPITTVEYDMVLGNVHNHTMKVTYVITRMQ